MEVVLFSNGKDRVRCRVLSILEASHRHPRCPRENGSAAPSANLTRSLTRFPFECQKLLSLTLSSRPVSPADRRKLILKTLPAYHGSFHISYQVLLDATYCSNHSLTLYYILIAVLLSCSHVPRIILWTQTALNSRSELLLRCL